MVLHVQGPMSTLALVGAIALAALPFLSAGPLGVSDLVSRRVHHGLDLVLVAFLAASPVIAWGHLDVAGVVTVEAAALVLLRVSLATSYQARRPGPAVIEARATAPADVAPRPGGSQPARPRLATGRAAAAGPAVHRLVGRSAYRLGGAVGRAKRPQRSSGTP